MTAGAIGVFVLVLGFGGFTVAWYLQGRESPARKGDGQLSAPPEGLSPGLAGVLLDERVHFHHVLATLLDLAQRDVVRINTSCGSNADHGTRDSEGFDVIMIDSAKRLRPYEDALLFAMFGQSGRSRQPGMVATLRSGQIIDYTEAKAIAHALYGEMIDRRYFAESPRVTRRRWYLIASGYMLTIVALMIVLAFTQSTDGDGTNLLVATISTVLLSILYAFGIAQRMPARTREGAVALARLKSFTRYLDYLIEQPVPNLSQQRLELLLPFVVSLRRDPYVLRKYLNLVTAMPVWFDGEPEDVLALHSTAAVVFTSRIKGGRVFAE